MSHAVSAESRAGTPLRHASGRRRTGPQPRAAPRPCAAWAVGVLVLFTAASCHEPLAPAEYGDPTLADRADEINGIHARVLGPSGVQPLTSPRGDVVLAAWTADGAELLVFAEERGDVLAVVDGEPGPDQRFRLPVELVHGANRIALRILEVDGRRTRTLELRLRYDGDIPGVRLHGITTEPDCTAQGRRSGTVVREQRVCVLVEASARHGAELDVQVALDEGAPVRAEPAGPSLWRAPITLAEEAEQRLRITARDAEGRTRTIEVSVRHTTQEPVVELVEPADGAVSSDPAIRVRGRVEAGADVAEVAVLRDGRLLARLQGTAEFDVEVPLSAGSNLIEVRAMDAAGNAGSIRRSVFREREIVLRSGGTLDTPIPLELDRFALEALVPEEDQRALVLLRLDLEPLVREAILAILEGDVEDPGIAEQNLQRLLSMSADTADLRGTRLEELLEIAGGIGLPAPRLLAELLGLDPLDPIADVDTVVAVTMDLFMATHPAVEREGGRLVLPLTLHDTLRDLEPLSERLGPAGRHPGLIDGPVSANLFEPGFRMRIAARSRLQRFDGVDVQRGRKDFAQLAPEGPLAEVDFLDPEAFSIVGLVDLPTTSLRLQVLESPEFLSAGTLRQAGEDPARPGFFRGGGAVWEEDPWVLERLIAETGYRIFVDRWAEQNWRRTLRYDAGAIVDAAVKEWDRGWLTIRTAGGVGAPPAPAYAWEVLTEIFQVRLHDGGLAEGEANVAFTLRDLPVGLDAESLVEALRPLLQADADRFVDAVLGDSPLQSDATDFHFVPGGFDGYPPSLRRREGAGPFYLDAALSTPAQGVAQRDDASRVAIRPGDVLWLRAEDERLYRVAVVRLSDDSAVVRVRPEEGLLR